MMPLTLTGVCVSELVCVSEDKDRGCKQKVFS